MTGIDLIKQFEGCKLKAYICPAGKNTIGWGHTKGVRIGDTISQSLADKILQDDYLECENQVKKMVTVPLNANQMGALCSFVFNLGAGALMGSTLLRKLNTGDYKGAALEFEKWVYAKDPKTGVRVILSGLERRRKAERQLFESK